MRKADCPHKRRDPCPHCAREAEGAMTAEPPKGELPDVWLVFMPRTDGRMLPEQTVCLDAAGVSIERRYVPASRLEASEARCRELHGMLALAYGAMLSRMPDASLLRRIADCLARERSATEPSDSGNEGQIDQ